MNKKPIVRNQKVISVLEAIKKIPEEVLWKANFNSANSIETYGNAIHSFLIYLGVSSPEELREINHGHVIAFKKHMQSQNHSPRTINNRLSAISSLFNHLIDKQIVKINVAQGVRRMRVNTDRVEAKVLTPEEVRILLDAPDTNKLKGMRDKAILSTLFFCGCRISEICTLKVKNYYMEQGFYILDFIVKGGKRNRLAINQELKIIIDEYLNIAEHKIEKESYLFLPLKHSPHSSDKKRKLNRKTIDYIFKKYARQVELDGITPHSARATFITTALQNNCPIEMVQRTVGHSQIRTTQMYDKRKTKYRESASFSVRY